MRAMLVLAVLLLAGCEAPRFIAGVIAEDRQAQAVEARRACLQQAVPSRCWGDGGAVYDRAVLVADDTRRMAP